MQECSDGDTFEWTYYPPGKFKILLYFPEQDRFVNVDGTWDRYAFDSYFTVEVSGIEDVIVSENADGASIRTYASYDFSMEILSLIVRVICTIAVELLLALLFGYREKKSLVIIAAENLFTQITLNVLLNVINYQSGHYAFVFHYVWMEIVVLMIEAIVYRKHIGGMNPRTDKKYHPCWYAVTANVLSFVVGVGIAQAIPGMF